MMHSNSPEIFKILHKGDLNAFANRLDKISDVNILDLDGKNLLHFACSLNKLDWVQSLITKGIKIDQQDDDGNTPLWTATLNHRGNYDIINLLLENQANPLIKNKSKVSPLDFIQSSKQEPLLARFTKPPFRSGKGEPELARLFNYSLEAHQQDWTYAVAQAHRIDDYIEAYDTLIVDEDVKFSLMEMILQATDEQLNEELRLKAWDKVQPLLAKDFGLHQYSIYYWCYWDKADISNAKIIAPLMRELWIRSLNFSRPKSTHNAIAKSMALVTLVLSISYIALAIAAKFEILLSLQVKPFALIGFILIFPLIFIFMYSMDKNPTTISEIIELLKWCPRIIYVTSIIILGAAVLVAYPNYSFHYSTDEAFLKHHAVTITSIVAIVSAILLIFFSAMARLPFDFRKWTYS